ncbi:hypothetical protein LVJ59_17695 [Microbacterium sp. KKR3/1]|uniref:hypothetical protein n=1 Tax=Microbacterium sp. KKR3/1 TaxID=2904241 RepID=UPI001E530B5B|nr:hypothetical protein [Microbacterium sp. KKR3/1]MCE0510884.1 hypothetical protein [Microbacterium sp. KKR3/1]
MAQFASKLYPQTNPSSVILMNTRVARERGSSFHGIEYAFTGCVEAAGHFITLDWQRITDSRMIDHARRVIERLANLERLAALSG